MLRQISCKYEFYMQFKIITDNYCYVLELNPITVMHNTITPNFT